LYLSENKQRLVPLTT